jgi:hypothetical protein
MLGLTAACGGDQPLAPTAGPVAGPTAGGAAVTRSGVELLVLVDETGQARRVLIVRDERDPRVRAVERLGFRELSAGPTTGDGIAPSTRDLLGTAASRGIPLRYRRSPSAWDAVLDVQAQAFMSRQTPFAEGSASIAASNSSPTEPMRLVNQALVSLETELNDLLANQPGNGCTAMDAAPESGVVHSTQNDTGDPCADERADAESSFRIAAATTILAITEVIAGIVSPPLLPGIAAALPGTMLGVWGATESYSRDRRDLLKCEAQHPQYFQNRRR